jgi:hypothetical protein
MRASHIVPMIAVALAMSGCAGPAGPEIEGNPAIEGRGFAAVAFIAERAQYSHGDTAHIVLRNESLRTVGYNLCTAARELYTAGSWHRYESLRICTTALYSLAPGQEVVLREPITEEWQPGTYRIVTDIHPLPTGTPGEVFTAPFTVTP